MTKPASNVVLGTDHVLLMNTPSREGKCPVGTQSAMERGALASMGKKCPNTLERSCSSYPFKPEIRRERVGGMKSLPARLLHSFRSGGSRLRRPFVSSEDDMPTRHINLHLMSVLIIHPCAFPEAISLKFYFLNEAIANTDSGEFVFPTRALRLTKFSELIFKMKFNRRKGRFTLFQIRFLILFTWKHSSRIIWETQTHL